MSQQELFPPDPKPTKVNDDFQWRQLCRLGEMMGDGLHHEPDGKWIGKEYTRILKQVEPEIFKEMRKNKADSVDRQMTALLAEKTSPCCSAPFRQSRKGSKIAYCTKCNSRFKAKKARN